MISTLPRSVLVSVFAAALGPGRLEANPPKADLVLTGGVVYTVNAKLPKAEAIAVQGNRIVAVGAAKDIAALVGRSTRVIDLGGRAVVPGFEDSHAHVLSIGLARMNVDLQGTKSFAEVLERVASAARARPAGLWIVGRGWHEGKWSALPEDAVRGFPRHDALSALVPDNPVVLKRADGHAVLANAKAMELAGVGKDAADPDGGAILRDAEGNATGIFVDNAQALVGAPPPTPADNRHALDLAIEEALEKGVTSLTDAGATSEAAALYREYAAAGKLGVRLYVMASGLEVAKEWREPRAGLFGGFLTLRAVKLYADGGLGSRGAALLAPYSDDPGNSGLLVSPAAAIGAAARWALPRGFQVCTHAIGDRANRMVLDEYEAAFRAFPGVKDHRFRIEHAQILDETDIPRFGRLHVIASMQGIHAPSDRPWAESRLGPERIAAGAYAWRKLKQGGAVIVNGTDAPVEDLSPIQNFYASVTRMGPDGQPPGGFDPDQRMTREEALRSYTRDAAFGAFAEREKGSIEVGRLADLVVLSRDIMSVPEAEILSGQVDLTIVDGVVRFDREAAPGSRGTKP